MESKSHLKFSLCYSKVDLGIMSYDLNSSQSII